MTLTSLCLDTAKSMALPYGGDITSGASSGPPTSNTSEDLSLGKLSGGGDGALPLARRRGPLRGWSLRVYKGEARVIIYRLLVHRLLRSRRLKRREELDKRRTA